MSHLNFPLQFPANGDVYVCVYIYKSVYFRRLKDTKTNKKLFYHLSTYINMGGFRKPKRFLNILTINS